MKEIKNVRDIVNLSNKALMIIPNSVNEQIRFLHEQIGKTEWSGFLMMKLNGTLDDIDNLVAEVEGIFLCDIGDPHRTEYSSSDHIEDCFKVFPDYDFMETNRWNGLKKTSGVKMGQIHTHHDMGSFFSQTDIDDLNNNAGHHGLYISLIVAMDGKYKAKGAFVVESKDTSAMSLKDFDGISLKTIDKSEKLVTFNFDIQFEANEDWFIDRLESIRKYKKEQALANKNVKADNIIKRVIPNWSKTPNFKQPVKYQSDMLKDAGIKHEYFPGYGNIYTDENGISYGDDGKMILQDELQILRNESF